MDGNSSTSVPPVSILSDELLARVFSFLDADSLCNLIQHPVSSQWLKIIIETHKVWRHTFEQKWKVKHSFQNPCDPPRDLENHKKTFHQSCKQGKFFVANGEDDARHQNGSSCLMISHTHVQDVILCLKAKQKDFHLLHRLDDKDSLSSLAIRHGISRSEITRFNNIHSEHSLKTRSHIFIPVRDVKEISDKHAAVIRDPLLQRKFIVVFEQFDQNQEQQVESDDDLIRAETQSTQQLRRRGPHRQQQDSGFPTPSLVTQMVTDTMRRSFGIDQQTARYYLENNTGNLRAAIQEYKSDLMWELQQTEDYHHHHHHRV